MRNYTKRQVARENYSRHFLSFFFPLQIFHTHRKKEKAGQRKREITEIRNEKKERKKGQLIIE